MLVAAAGCCCWLLLLVAAVDCYCWLLFLVNAGFCCWLLLLVAVVDCWLLIAGCWLLLADCWLLIAGCWLLVVGCWSLLESLWIFPRYFWFADKTILQAKKYLTIFRQKDLARWWKRRDSSNIRVRAGCKRVSSRESRLVGGSKRMNIIVVHWVFIPR